MPKNHLITALRNLKEKKLTAFINISSSAATLLVNRTQATGMHKILDGIKKHLSWQFFGKAILISFIGLLLTMMLIQIALPYFNEAMGQALTIDEILSLDSLIALLTTVVMVGIISGLYPAFYLASFKPAGMFKEPFRASKDGTLLHRSLLIFQFSMATALTVGSIIIFDQLNYMSHASIGCDKEQMLMIPLTKEPDRTEHVTKVTAASHLPGMGFNQNTLWAKEGPQHSVGASGCFTLKVKKVWEKNPGLKINV